MEQHTWLRICPRWPSWDSASRELETWDWSSWVYFPPSPISCYFLLQLKHFSYSWVSCVAVLVVVQPFLSSLYHVITVILQNKVFCSITVFFLTICANNFFFTISQDIKSINKLFSDISRNTLKNVKKRTIAVQNGHIWNMNCSIWIIIFHFWIIFFKVKCIFLPN